jgi:hypothetical protein
MPGTWRGTHHRAAPHAPGGHSPPCVARRAALFHGSRRRRVRIGAALKGISLRRAELAAFGGAARRRRSHLTVHNGPRALMNIFRSNQMRTAPEHGCYEPEVDTGPTVTIVCRWARADLCTSQTPGLLGRIMSRKFCWTDQLCGFRSQASGGFGAKPCLGSNSPV